MLAHVPAIIDFIGGFVEIPFPEEVATFEFPHLSQMITEAQSDAIYHEHYSCLLLGVVKRVFSGHCPRIINAENLPTRDGGFRVFATPTPREH